jgi:hypothetical protein
MLVSKYYYAMGKYFLLLIPLLIWGCDKTYDNVINTSTENYQVTSIVGIKDTVDLKNLADSLLSARIIFSSQSEVNRVEFNVIASDFTQLNSTPIVMTEVADNIFDGNFIFNNQYPNGNYSIKFSANGLNGINKQVAVSNFYFNNGQDNLPPVISNLFCPDSIDRGVSFIFSVVVYDTNGRNDILSTFFSLYRPDGTPVEETPGDIYFAMHDDGNLAIFGDSTANDGIYSFKNSFGATSQTGNWKFIFQAIDRSNTLSNIIEHYLYVE